MKIIIERIGNTIYSYRESEAHFKIVEPDRAKHGNQIPADALDYECNLDVALKDGDYIVQDLALRD